jgi:hypothetical protein
VVLLAAGLGLIFVSTTITAVAGVARQESGLASALLNVAQQLGGSVGLAVLGTVAATTTKNSLMSAIPMRLAIAHAITLGYGSAFQVAALAGLAGVVIAVALVQGRARGTRIEMASEAA